jgi:hypothetical protein
MRNDRLRGCDGEEKRAGAVQIQRLAVERGIQSFTGENLSPASPPPANVLFVGAPDATPRTPARAGSAGEEYTRKPATPMSIRSPEDRPRPRPQLRPAIVHRRRPITGNLNSGERTVRRSTRRHAPNSGESRFRRRRVHP